MPEEATAPSPVTDIAALPIMFATLYVFTLLGLFMNIIGDLAMTLVDPRIDFEKR